MAKSMAVGTTFSINSKAVGGLKSIGGVEVNADQAEVTSLDNTTGYKEYLAGFKDGGEVPLSGYLDGEDDGQEECYTLLNSGAAKACVITFPSTIGKKWTFTGVVTKFATSVDVNDAITFDCTIKVSGQPVLADVTPPSSGG